jgi:uncharacterized phage-associated protein
MELNKLAYYVQAWSLVWREQPAFAERIEAWKDGPVVQALWISQNHNASSEILNARALSPELSAHVDRVLLAYGHLSPDELSELTHNEEPWKHARGNTPAGAASDVEITHDAMTRYYGHRWIEAERDNAAARGEPGFRGSVDEFEAFLSAK